MVAAAAEAAVAMEVTAVVEAMEAMVVMATTCTKPVVDLAAEVISTMVAVTEAAAETAMRTILVAYGLLIKEDSIIITACVAKIRCKTRTKPKAIMWAGKKRVSRIKHSLRLDSVQTPLAIRA